MIQPRKFIFDILFFNFAIPAPVVFGDTNFQEANCSCRKRHQSQPWIIRLYATATRMTNGSNFAIRIPATIHNGIATIENRLKLRNQLVEAGMSTIATQTAPQPRRKRLAGTMRARLPRNITRSSMDPCGLCNSSNRKNCETTISGSSKWDKLGEFMKYCCAWNPAKNLLSPPARLKDR